MADAGSDISLFPPVFMGADEARRSLLADTYEDSSLGWQSKKKFLSKLAEFDPDNPDSRGGAAIYVHDGRILVDSECTHSLICSGTGTGKTMLFMLPSAFTCIMSGESVFVIDPKEDCRKRLKPICDRLGIDTVVLNLRHPAESDRISLMAEIFRKYKSGGRARSEAIQDVEKITLALIPDEENRSKDTYWTQSARSILRGSIVLLLKRCTKAEEITFTSMTVIAGRVFDENSTDNCWVKNLPEEDYVSQCFMPILNNADSTARSIYGTFRGYMSKFSTNFDLNNLLFGGDKNIFDIGDRQKIVFLVMPDDSGTYFCVASLITSMLIQKLYERSSREPDGALPVKCNILLDEFGIMPPIPDVDVYLSTSRSRNIRWIMCIQSFSQLTDRYQEKAGIILGNVSNLMFMFSQELKTLEHIQKQLGKNENGEFLMPISELQSIPFGRAIAMRRRMKPFMTYLDHIADRLCPIPAEPSEPVSEEKPEHESPECSGEAAEEEETRIESGSEADQSPPETQSDHMFSPTEIEEVRAILDRIRSTMDLKRVRPKKSKGSDRRVEKVSIMFDETYSTVENGIRMFIAAASEFKKRADAVDALSRRIALGFESMRSAEAMSRARDALALISDETYEKISSETKGVF